MMWILNFTDVSLPISNPPWKSGNTLFDMLERNGQPRSISVPYKLPENMNEDIFRGFASRIWHSNWREYIPILDYLGLADSLSDHILYNRVHNGEYWHLWLSEYTSDCWYDISINDTRISRLRDVELIINPVEHLIRIECIIRTWPDDRRDTIAPITICYEGLSVRMNSTLASNLEVEYLQNKFKELAKYYDDVSYTYSPDYSQDEWSSCLATIQVKTSSGS